MAKMIKAVELDLNQKVAMRDVPALVAELFGGKPVTRQAVYQWSSLGIKKKIRGRMKLQTRHYHGQLYTTVGWVKEFMEAI